MIRVLPVLLRIFFTCVCRAPAFSKTFFDNLPEKPANLLPKAHASGIDMDKVGGGVIADAAHLQGQCGSP